MIGLSSFEWLALWLFIVAATRSLGESTTCLAVYRDGGAPAVFKSPKCPRWKLPSHDSESPTTDRCQIAMLQGRRYYQEDRALCALDLRIPFPGTAGIKEVVVGIVAVFDGHNGAEASDMASKLLLEYFVLHTYFLLDATYSALLKRSIGRLPSSRNGDEIPTLLDWGEILGHFDLDLGRFKHSMTKKLVDSSHLEILKEALLRAIHDIDATFSKEASRRNLESGSTATIILLADGQILVANIGDSKAFICSEKSQSPSEAKATYLRLYRKERQSGAGSRLRNYRKFSDTSFRDSVHFSVKELTRDHHPNRDDEKLRVETAGGYVVEWGGVPRVNGRLAISRAIGDVPFKRYGIISAPELTDWQSVTLNDSYLVAASDGVFEKLSLQDVCDLIWDEQSSGQSGSGLSSSCGYSLSECIVNTALEKGSMDNVAAVVVPLSSMGFSENLLGERLNREEVKGTLALGLHKSTPAFSVNEITSDIVQVKLSHLMMAKFKRLLVEGKDAYIGCFYLSENLDKPKNNVSQLEKLGHDEYSVQVQTADHDDYSVAMALPGSFDSRFSGSVNYYHEHNLCFHLGLDSDGAKDQCINPVGFASFIGFLESIPFQDSGLNYGSFAYESPNSSYVLKKKFGRGSYGEVWLAFHWNCYQGRNSSKGSGRYNNTSAYSDQLHSRFINDSTFSHNCNSTPPNDSIFILKRIMVERGASVYLSGLREKYFGESFLNASSSIMENTEESMVDEMGNGSFESGVREDGLLEEGLNHIARFVESFESRASEIWLVFHYEGISLSKILYSMEEVDKEVNEGKKHAQLLSPSKWWHWLKTSEAGQEEMRSIIWQLLMALKSCHDRNITHRDIKPENMVVCFEDQNTGRCVNKVPEGQYNVTAKMRIIDFGSAMDEFSLRNLYGSAGPSRAEQTSDYSPPEALLNSSWHQGPMSTNSKYDMWSVGVVILEMVLGSPNVFQISAYTRALLDRHLDGWSEGLKELAYKLRSYMELCILVPGDLSNKHRAGKVGVTPVSWKCSEEFFSNQIKNRDPLKLGFPNVWLLRLVRHLLLWDPEERLSVDEALQHPYFKVKHPPKS